MFWVVGFYFSQEEPTALVQTEGGPCAVIAPVQAFILKRILQENITSWKDVTSEKSDELLVKAMTEIIDQAVDPENRKYFIVHTSSCKETEQTPSESAEGSSTQSDTPSSFFHNQLR